MKLFIILPNLSDDARSARRDNAQFILEDSA